MIEFEKEVVEYLNIPNIPKKEWNQQDSFQDGVAVVGLSLGRQAYAVCTFNKDEDREPRIKKVFGIEPFTSIEKIFVVPAYMDNDTSDADLDSESKKRAEQLAEEAKELENAGTVDESIEKANLLPEWIFDEIHNREEAMAWLKQYNIRNKIKKGKVPTNEETIKMRLYNIYMSQNNHK
jgi:hypothetical protein